ncbi:hypothetical protein AMECASPLE_005552, partial [Ameca splendens]
RKLHTQPHSMHPCCILPSTTQRAATGRQGPHATLPQPPPTSTTEQTPPSTVLKTDPLTPHQDRTNSPGKRFRASGTHHGPGAPTMPPQPPLNTTTLPLRGQRMEKHQPAQLHRHHSADSNTGHPISTSHPPH